MSECEYLAYKNVCVVVCGFDHLSFLVLVAGFLMRGKWSRGVLITMNVFWSNIAVVFFVVNFG